MLAKIYRPAKNAMQSGKAGTKRWVLDFEPNAALAPDVLMGWSSSADPSGQIRLYFDDRDQAIAYARKHAIPHQVIEPREFKRAVKSYSDNFAFARKEPWSH
ncbi:MAG: ETC complex I subunit [Caulobacterales bacterium]